MSALKNAEPEAKALDVVSRWTGAFPNADIDGIASLFAGDATFLGTTSRDLVANPEGIRDYFERALLQNRPRGARLREHSVVALSNEVVLVTGLDEVTGVKEGQTYSSPGRVTFVLALREGGWRIVHLHRSAVPA